MNVTDYIASGILEEYVSGSASEQEQQEVECMGHIYPEIKQELEALSLAMEGYAQAHAVQAPEHIKTAIFAQLADGETLVETQKETPVVALNSPSKAFRWKWTIAASLVIIAFLGFTYAQLRMEHADVLVAIQKQKELTNDLQKELTANQKALAEVESKTYLDLSTNQLVPLNAVAGQDEALFATVAWDRSSKEVHIESGSLPVVDAAKQYQLWAIVDGNPDRLWCV